MMVGLNGRGPLYSHNLWLIWEVSLDFRIASYIRIVGVVITAWLTWDIKSIIVFTMETMNSSGVEAISMALNPSGHLQNEG